MPPSLSAPTRRRFLRVGAGASAGLSLGGLWRTAAASPPTAPAGPVRACILLFYYGGPSHLDTFDLKPDAPAEIRGEFKPIATSVPGVRVCEHLPRLAARMHRIALVRSVTHAARLHDSASIHALTGRPLDGPDRELFAPQPQFYPCHGSAVDLSAPRPERRRALRLAAFSVPQCRRSALPGRRLPRIGLRPTAHRGGPGDAALPDRRPETAGRRRPRPYGGSPRPPARAGRRTRRRPFPERAVRQGVPAAGL